MPRLPRHLKLGFPIRVRRSTLALIAAFIAVWVLYEAVHPNQTKQTLVPYGPAPVVTAPPTTAVRRTTVVPRTTTTLPSITSTTAPLPDTTTTSVPPGGSTTTSGPPGGTTTTAGPPTTPTSGP